MTDTGVKPTKDWPLRERRFVCEHCEKPAVEFVAYQILSRSEWIDRGYRPESKWIWWRDPLGLVKPRDLVRVEVISEAALDEFLQLESLCGDCNILAS